MFDSFIEIKFPKNIDPLILEHFGKELRQKVVRTLIHFAVSYLFEIGLFAVLVINRGQTEQQYGRDKMNSFLDNATVILGVLQE
jgi:hypothetical protein